MAATSGDLSTASSTGKMLTLRPFEGILISDLFDESRLRSALRYEPRDDDVFVVGFPKTGTTWIHFAVRCLLNRGREKPLQSAAACLPFVSFLEMAGAEQIMSLPRPGAVIKTHLPFESVHFSEKARYIYVLRNPYDTCVSYYHQIKQTVPGCSDTSFEEFFEHFINGHVHPNDYFDHLASWFAQRSKPNFLCVAYEDVKKDPRSGILRIAAFLNKDLEKELQEDPTALDSVILAISAEAMKKAFADARPRNKPSGPSTAAAQNKPEKHAGATTRVPGSNLVRKATVGDWKNHFSAEQIERMRAKMASKTADFRADLDAFWKDAGIP